jgi:PTH1 family peptidyl-tRNA hydrolase
MRLVIGLGNPGKKYDHTRHNAGFMALDFWQKKMDWPEFKEEKKFFALVAVGKIGREKIVLAKPTTYMNDSGTAVRALIDFYKIKPEQVIIIQDDKDIAIGKIKVQIGRSDAGHNGIKSLISHLGTNAFVRIRIGIAPTDPRQLGVTSYFVLHDFTHDEMLVLKNVFNNVVKELEKVVRS